MAKPKGSSGEHKSVKAYHGKLDSLEHVQLPELIAARERLQRIASSQPPGPVDPRREPKSDPRIDDEPPTDVVEPPSSKKPPPKKKE